MKGRGLLLSAATVLVVAVIAGAINPPGLSGDSTLSPIIDVRGLAYDDSRFCVLCDVCSGGHATAEHPDALRLGVGHPCMEGVTCLAHDPCVVTLSPGKDPSVGQLWTALTGAKRSEVERLMGRYPDRLRFAPSRDAVQILGCNGGIVAHLPLSAEQLSSLGE